MSTHATISAKQENGSTHTTHLHNGGNILPFLQAHYDTPEKVAALIKLGDLSILDKSTDCPEGHKFGDRIDGYCVAYYRDRGEPWRSTCPRSYHNIEQAMEHERDQHNFYHDGENWTRV